MASQNKSGKEPGATCLSHWRILLIAGILLIGIVVVVMHGPVSQDPAYHHFADQRAFFGIPNVSNVVSNLLFLAAAAAGLLALYSGRCPGAIPALRPAYGTFFIGSGLIAFASGYYHLNPTNAGLVLDRFAMTVAFMAFMAIILGEHIDQQLGRLSLLPLLAMGLLSVLIWKITEAGGQGDLRFYALIQFLPLILVPLIMVLYPSKLTKVYFIWGILIAYAIGKAFEMLDAPIFKYFIVSGHTLKHLMAAIGAFFAVLAIKKREQKS